jgi:hypothetical protein
MTNQMQKPDDKPDGKPDDIWMTTLLSTKMTT